MAANTLTLDEVFEAAEWEDKRRALPQVGRRVEVWREADSTAADAYFRRHREQTSRVRRIVWLFADSLGAALVVTEVEQRDED